MLTFRSVLGSVILAVGLALAVATAGHAMAAEFVISDLGTLGGTFSIATGVNDLGQVVGYSATADGATHAFLWQSGTMTDLGTLRAAAGESHATGINRLGQVVGYSTAADGDGSSRLSPGAHRWTHPARSQRAPPRGEFPESPRS